MATDSPDSRRKHPHSPSEDESLDRSKRPKHRHHHRSHHRHSSRSKDHDDERKADVEVTNKDEFVIGNEDADSIARSTQAKADSEMEEGEIVEDEGLSASCAEKVMSDSESGEIRAVGGPSNSNTKIMEHEGMFGSTDEQSLVNGIGNPSGKLKAPAKTQRKENIVNGDVGKSKGKSKHKGLSGHEVEEGAWLDRYGVTQSPSHGRYHDEASGRLRSKSPNYRRKSDSETVSVENHSRRGHGHVHHDNDREEYILDDDMITDTSRDDRYHGRDSVRDKDREKVHAVDMGRHSDRESWDIESEDKYRDRRAEKERKTRYRDHDEERRHLERDRGVRECSKARESKKEREYETKAEKPGRSRGSVHDEEYDEGRYREKDYRRSKERDLEREHRRGSSRSSYKDRDLERERGKSRERYRDRSHEVSDRLRDNGSDRHGDKFKDAGRDRVRRNYGRDDEDRYGNHGGSYDSKYRTYGEDHHRDKKRIGDSENDCKENDKTVTRDENALDDYSDNMELERQEHEEDDINRIKEESRKRREAILQKYRTQKSQQKFDPQPDTSGKVITKEISEEHAAAQVLQGKSDDEGEHAFSVGKSPSQNDASMVEKSSGTGGLGQGTPKSERSNDMFRDDIFGDSPAEVPKTGKGDGLPVERSGLHDNWDDPEGYYGYRLGEILDTRYEVIAAHGKGVFSIVVRAKDLKAGKGDPQEVAIKIIRNNDTMLKAGMDELVILKKLVGADPDDRRHCVRYISSFKYRNHLCLIFESLHMNLREVLKKFGRNIGLKLTAVRAYSKQLFIALKHLKNCGVLHCDIKLDNMVVNEAKNVLKLCDFGNAMFAGKNEVTPYLVSRFYRAPEIILGLTYDHPLDMWSAGCCLYELYTGKVLFPGATNNDMLRLHMELKGPFPKKMLRKGAFAHQHFDHDLNFLSFEEDLVTKKAIRRLIVNIKPKDIGTIIKGSPGEDPKLLANFKDLLDKIFVLDPDKRLTVSQALSHPFITGK